MADTNETIADIIAWLRRPREGENAYLTLWRDEIADRLEAAYKREKAAIEADALSAGGLIEAMRQKKATAENSSAVGDCAKLREAVVEIIDYLEPIRKWTAPSKENHTKLTALFAAVDTVYTKAKNALAAPVKNCEVGTVEEQFARFRKFCKKDSMDSFESTAYCAYECPCGNNYDCKLAWAQMPYSEGGAK